MAYFLPPDAPVEKVRALLTISGGERISCSDLWVDRARSK
jgi:hypothetical protein